MSTGIKSTQLSVTILVKDAERTLKATLDSLKSFEDVVVIDNGSKDRTVEIAKSYPNVRVVHESFIGFGPLHNVATTHCKHDFILSIDSDEVLTEELQKEILLMNFNPQKAYALKRKSFYRGHFVKGCGWYPDPVVRIFNRKNFRFTADQVHEKVDCTPNDIVFLKGYLNHTPYLSVRDFLSKMQLYSDLFAEQAMVKSSPGKAVGHGLFTFFKSYFLKKGFIDGYAGLLISAYNGHTAFYKYLKLYERQQDAKKGN